jgi:erythritol transport system ATP-binding protein
MHDIGDVLLKADEITLPRMGGGYTVDHISLELHRGEILGLYGLMGAGRSELLECMAGLRSDSTGKVLMNEKDLSGTLIKERIQKGLVLIPEDRQRDGIVQTLSVAHNMLLASLTKYLSFFALSANKEKAAATDMIKDLFIRVSNPQQIITSLSGGNQQKVVVAKGLLTKPKVLMMDEPTRGIDVGAKSEIFEIMSKLASQGLGILFVSSELKEILAMSDRILVLSKGKITGEFTHDQATEELLVSASGVGHGVGKNATSNGGING